MQTLCYIVKNCKVYSLKKESYLNISFENLQVKQNKLINKALNTKGV